MSGWQPIDGFGSARSPRGDLAGQLLLALRQCATHPAGPLRAVSEIRAAQLDGFDIVAVEHAVRAELATMRMPPEREETMHRFLEVVFAGLADLQERT